MDHVANATGVCVGRHDLFVVHHFNKEVCCAVAAVHDHHHAIARVHHLDAVYAKASVLKRGLRNGEVKAGAVVEVRSGIEVEGTLVNAAGNVLVLGGVAWVKIVGIADAVAVLVVVQCVTHAVVV